MTNIQFDRFFFFKIVVDYHTFERIAEKESRIYTEGVLQAISADYLPTQNTLRDALPFSKKSTLVDRHALYVYE